MMVRRGRWLACTCGALLLGVAGIATASASGQAPLGRALEPGQKTTGGVLKGELLRRCKTLDEEILLLETRLSVLQSAMKVYSKQLDDYDTELDAMRASMDNTDADAVARYNRSVENQHAIIAKHDALLPEHNELVERQNPRVDEFNAKCAGVSYFRDEWLKADVTLDPNLMPPATQF